MKFTITLTLLLSFSISFSQWTRVQQLPSSNIFTLFHKDSVVYAGGTNVIYISRNRGQTWDSTIAIPQLSPVTSMINNIIVYKNELYAAASSKGIFKSPDGGTTWQIVNAGIDSLITVTDFCEDNGFLYAATEGSFGNSIYKLDPVNRNNWLSFSNNLTSISSNINSIMGNGNALIAGTNDNGLYDYLPANSTTWEERFLTSPVSVHEAASDIITAHDTFFLAGKTGNFFISTDNGFNWSLFGNRLVTGATFIANAKQAVISSRYIFDGASSTTLFYYIKKDSLQQPFRNFSIVANHFTWKIDILGDKLWDASDRGLFYMPLSSLPGISAADDSIPGVLPLRFISFNANCDNNKVLLAWKTVQEQNTSHFNIERSIDGIGWTVVGNVYATGNTGIERIYSFTDNHPVQNSYYRIKENDLDGKAQYSTRIRACYVKADEFNIFPNPVSDKLFVHIISGDYSKALIQLFDSKGALVKSNSEILLKGENQINIDMKLQAKGTYYLSASWNNGLMQKRIKVIKQ